jgi:predicted PurR-regulated permease PerM
MDEGLLWLLLATVGVVVGLVWLILPFIIWGMSNAVDRIEKQAALTNAHLLAMFDMIAAQSSDATSHLEKIVKLLAPGAVGGERGNAVAAATGSDAVRSV